MPSSSPSQQKKKKQKRTKMSTSELERALQAVLAQDERSNLPRVRDSIEEIVRVHALAQPVSEALEEHEQFKSGGHMLSSHGYAGGLIPLTVAPAMVRYLLETRDVAETLNWLERLFATRRDASGSVVVALWGVRVERSFDLDESTSIVPFADVPESAAKRWFYDAVVATLRTPFHLKSPPLAAIVSRVTISPVLVPTQAFDHSLFGKHHEEDSRLRSCVLALTVVGPCAPTIAGKWFTFDDADLERVGQGGIAPGSNEIIPALHHEDRLLDETRARDAVRLFFACATKSPLTIALERLNQSLRRYAIADRVLDLAIAFESLLGEREGEHRYKISLRAARLTGKDVADRRRRRACIQALYDIRSRVVHGGRAPARIGSVTPDQVFAEAAVICADVISAILVNGSMPDWRELEIG